MKIKPKDIEIKDYHYELPQDRIAQHPLAERDKSKLMIVSPPSAEGKSLRVIQHRQFSELPQEIPPGAMLVLNETKVICARLDAKKSTGGSAEVFLLSPVSPTRDPAIALKVGSGDNPRWRAMIGGKNIKAGDVLAIISSQGDATESISEVARALILEKNGSDALVELSWDYQQNCLRTMADLLDFAGRVPLPPYMPRPDTKEDQSRYQTVFAKDLGSVAAPTASLHFTKDTFKGLYVRGIKLARLVLHVGAGTFKPVESAKIGGHSMHDERITVSRSCLLSLRLQLEENKPIIAVGTTSLRTLESLYWFGVAAYSDCLPRHAETGVPQLSQWAWLNAEGEPRQENISPIQAISALIYWVDALGLDQFSAHTEIMIAPGYDFKLVDGLVTNFHQPGSSLILLIAAFLGDGTWRQVYDEALNKRYRFLSYGDSSLLWRHLPQKK
jgi:S-adenosylmethionine:tRNA ribosyltransferase-isomerase